MPSGPYRDGGSGNDVPAATKASFDGFVAKGGGDFTAALAGAVSEAMASRSVPRVAGWTG